MNLINKSRGDILLRLPDGSSRNFKHSSDAYQMLEAVKSRKAGVEISLTDHRDVKPCIQYMAEAAL